MLVLGGCLAAAACLLPFDDAIARFCTRFQAGGDLRLGGDVRRTLELLQQFGDGATSVIVGIVVLLMAPRMKMRVADWVLAAVTTSLCVSGLKMLFGRPRPRVVMHPSAQEGFDSATAFAGPIKAFPLPRNGPDGTVEYLVAKSWEMGKGISSDLWSMPSSHTSAAAVLGVVLAGMFPRLTPLCVGLVAIVAVSRVLLGAHFPSDVVVGAGVGYVLGNAVFEARWGSRLLRGLGAGKAREGL